MAEYIDKQEAIDIFKQFKKRKWISMPIEQVIELISVVPYIEAEPVKHGRWIKVGDSSWKCSVCHEVSCCNGNYCVDCGARNGRGE